MAVELWKPPGCQTTQNPSLRRNHLSSGVLSCVCSSNHSMGTGTPRRHGHLPLVNNSELCLASALPIRALLPTHQLPSAVCRARKTGCPHSGHTTSNKTEGPPRRPQPPTCPLQAAGPSSAVLAKSWSLDCHSSEERYRSPWKKGPNTPNSREFNPKVRAAQMKTPTFIVLLPSSCTVCPPALVNRPACLQGRLCRDGAEGVWQPGGTGDISPLSPAQKAAEGADARGRDLPPPPRDRGVAKHRGQASGPAGGAELFRDTPPPSPPVQAGCRRRKARGCPARGCPSPAPPGRGPARHPRPGGREGAHLGCMGPGAGAGPLPAAERPRPQPHQGPQPQPAAAPRAGACPRARPRPRPQPRLGRNHRHRRRRRLMGGAPSGAGPAAGGGARRRRRREREAVMAAGAAAAAAAAGGGRGPLPPPPAASRKRRHRPRGSAASRLPGP